MSKSVQKNNDKRGVKKPSVITANNLHLLHDKDNELELKKLRNILECKEMNTKLERCKYSKRACYLPVLDKYEYCRKHILEDKRAPFEQCTYTYLTQMNKRCLNPAPISSADKPDAKLCPTHQFKSAERKRKVRSNIIPEETTEGYLSLLTHYATPIIKRPTIRRYDDSTQQIEKDLVGSSLPKNQTNINESSGEVLYNVLNRRQADLTKKFGTNFVSGPNAAFSLNPFEDIDYNKKLNRKADILACITDSDSDAEPMTFTDTTLGVSEESSDAESVASIEDDCLRYAGVYTEEEVFQFLINRLHRLKHLYSNQLDTLISRYIDIRKKYLPEIKKEKETLLPMEDQAKLSKRDAKLYAKYRALVRYNTRTKTEYNFFLKSLEKIAKETKNLKHYQKPSSNAWVQELIEKSVQIQTMPAKCIFTEGGVRCTNDNLPLSKHCLTHILSDPNQILFKPCGATKLDSVCQEPVINYGSDDVFQLTCILHHRPNFLQIKKETGNFSKDAKEKPEILKVSAENVKVTIPESEIDNSATESAFSTDKDSPMEIVQSSSNGSVDTNQEEIMEVVKNNSGRLYPKILKIEMSNKMHTEEQSSSAVNENVSKIVESNNSTDL